MLIANPMYDTVFKYLMENLNVAKGIISTIIGEEILILDFMAQEQTHRAAEPAVLLFHLDFIAKIRTKNGGSKTVLIELQKFNIPYDILRFRRYLGKKNTQADDVLHEDGTVTQEALPIITIYFLGFNIDGDLPAVRNKIQSKWAGDLNSTYTFIFFSLCLFVPPFLFSCLIPIIYHINLYFLASLCCFKSICASI